MTNGNPTTAEQHVPAWLRDARPYHGVAITSLGEDGEVMVALGHIDPAAFIAAANEYVADAGVGKTSPAYDQRDEHRVWHTRASTVPCPDESRCDCDGQHLRYGAVLFARTTAFPITVLED